MFMLITYDVDTTTQAGARRLRQVARQCVNYGHRVQSSVFECIVTEAQFVVLRDNLQKIIDIDTDSIRFYFMGKNRDRRIATLGVDHSIDFESAIVI